MELPPHLRQEYEALAARLDELRAAVAELRGVEDPHWSWPDMLNTYLVLIGHLDGLSRRLLLAQADMRATVLEPLGIAAEHSTDLERLTEGRISTLTADVMSSVLLRTRPAPEDSDAAATRAARAAARTADPADASSAEAGNPASPLIAFHRLCLAAGATLERACKESEDATTQAVAAAHAAAIRSARRSGSTGAAVMDQVKALVAAFTVGQGLPSLSGRP